MASRSLLFSNTVCGSWSIACRFVVRCSCQENIRPGKQWLDFRLQHAPTESPILSAPVSHGRVAPRWSHWRPSSAMSSSASDGKATNGACGQQEVSIPISSWPCNIASACISAKSLLTVPRSQTVMRQRHVLAINPCGETCVHSERHKGWEGLCKMLEHSWTWVFTNCPCCSKLEPLSKAISFLSNWSRPRRVASAKKHLWRWADDQGHVHFYEGSYCAETPIPLRRLWNTSSGFLEDSAKEPPKIKLHRVQDSIQFYSLGGMYASAMWRCGDVDSYVYNLPYMIKACHCTHSVSASASLSSVPICSLALDCTSFSAAAKEATTLLWRDRIRPQASHNNSRHPRSSVDLGGKKLQDRGSKHCGEMNS